MAGVVMKNTHYILNDSLDFNSVGIIALPTIMFAVPALVGLLGGAVLMDGGRIIKLKYLLRQRELRRINYIKCVLRSLDFEATRENIKMLKIA